jgi:hypothetical protein
VNVRFSGVTIPQLKGSVPMVVDVRRPLFTVPDVAVSRTADARAVGVRASVQSGGLIESAGFRNVPYAFGMTRRDRAWAGLWFVIRSLDSYDSDPFTPTKPPRAGGLVARLARRELAYMSV